LQTPPNQLLLFLPMRNYLLVLGCVFSLVSSAQVLDSVTANSINFRSLGPYRGGRSAAVAGSFKNKLTFYMGATGGGVWKTTDGGNNWKNISDKTPGFGGSIGAVAVSPSNENIIYVGEGENTMRGNVSEGINGVWKSEDGGRSWKKTGLADGRHIVRLIIHPNNPNIVWAAVMGHLFGPNNERGVFKTTDGGKTWNKVLFVNPHTGCSDLVMEPNNPSVLYAGMWRVIRRPYSLESGGDGSGFYKSTDGGETWQNISANKGLPTGIWGIVGVAVSASNTDKVYVQVENAAGGLFVSNDAGQTFTLVNSSNDIRQRSWYFSKLFVDPKNENLVWLLNVSLYKSTDGGKTLKNVSTPHGDHHDLWLDPEDGNRAIIADDGGAQVSFDGGGNWSTYNNQPTVQIYRVSTDNAFPYHILGAQQDNSTIRMKSRTYGGSITDKDWTSTAGFESGYVVADPSNPNIVYGGNYGGYLSRYNHLTDENRNISVWPDNPLGAGADVQRYRFQWNFPIFFSPHNPKKLYAGGNHLFASENEGQSWNILSPDLTTNNKAMQASSGGLITQDNTSVEYYCTIFTATESAQEKDLLWVGTDDGLIQVSKNGGANWENVTPKNIPAYIMWNAVEVDPFKKGAAYFVGTRYKSNDYTPYIYKTEDYGKTWKLLTAGINKMHFTRVLRADLVRKGLLYCGTEYGMYVSYNDGLNWQPMQANLPIVPITDMTIKNNDLIVATQGRGFYVLDDLHVLQQYKPENTKANLYAYNPAPIYRVNGFVNPNARNAGANPPNGVVLNFFIKQFYNNVDATIRFTDKNNKVLKTLSTKATEPKNKIELKQGMNQLVWNLEDEPAETIEGMILWNGAPGGAKVPPGNYIAQIVYGADSVLVPFEVKGNPNLSTTIAEYESQYTYLQTIKAKFNEVQTAIKDIRKLRDQLKTLKEKNSTAANSFIKLTDSTIQKLTTIEEALYQTKAKSVQDVLNFPIRLNDKIAGVFDAVNSGYAAPSQQSKAVYDELAVQANQQLNELNNVKTNNIKQINKMVHELALDVIK
jgi:photosystem II stability/assembly factor-like uncharacterized protein